jgi:hypothetical protein
LVNFIYENGLVALGRKKLLGRAWAMISVCEKLNAHGREKVCLI